MRKKNLFLSRWWSNVSKFKQFHQVGKNKNKKGEKGAGKRARNSRRRHRGSGRAKVRRKSWEFLCGGSCLIIVFKKVFLAGKTWQRSATLQQEVYCISHLMRRLSHAGFTLHSEAAQSGVPPKFAREPQPTCSHWTRNCCATVNRRFAFGCFFSCWFLTPNTAFFMGLLYRVLFVLCVSCVSCLTLDTECWQILHMYTVDWVLDWKLKFLKVFFILYFESQMNFLLFS